MRSACQLFVLIGSLVWGVCAWANTTTEQSPVESLSALVRRCAPSVHPTTMEAIIKTESKGHAFALADAGPVHLPWSERKHLVRSYFESSVESATKRATELVAAGHTVSLGLAQINNRNLAALGLSIREVFDPCTNIGAGAKILTDFYQRASAIMGEGDQALRAAISAYYSGDWSRGQTEGYVATVLRNVGRPLALQTATLKKTPAPSRLVALTQPQSEGRQFTLSADDFAAQLSN